MHQVLKLLQYSRKAQANICVPPPPPFSLLACHHRGWLYVRVLPLPHLMLNKNGGGGGNVLEFPPPQPPRQKNPGSAPVIGHTDF